VVLVLARAPITVGPVPTRRGVAEKTAAGGLSLQLTIQHHTNVLLPRIQLHQVISTALSSNHAPRGDADRRLLRHPIGRCRVNDETEGTFCGRDRRAELREHQHPPTSSVTGHYIATRV